MKKLILWVLVIIMSFLPVFGKTEKSLAIINVTVIDVREGLELSEMTVIISGNQISQVGKTNAVKIPKGAKVINGAGKFLIPGLWDVHTHFTDSGKSSFSLFIANGVTSIRDMYGDLDQLKAWRKEIEGGKIIGPRMKITGAAIEGSEVAGFHKFIKTPAEAEEFIASLAAKGADHVKIRSYASKEVYIAICESAKRHNLKLVGHAPWGIDYSIGFSSGQVSFEHGYYPYPLSKMSAEEKKQVIETMVKNNVYLVPTLVTWEPRTKAYMDVEAMVNDRSDKLDPRRKYIEDSLLNTWKEGLRYRKEEKREGLAGWREVLDSSANETGELFRAGVSVMPGTDTGATAIFPGFDLHEELRLFVEKMGLTPAETLRSATLAPAEFYGISSTLGTIEQGKLADLVLLNANPLNDVKNTKQISAVVVNGRFLAQKDLQKMLEQVEKTVKLNRKRVSTMLEKANKQS